MATVEQLRDRLEKLRAVRAAGRRRVEYDGYSVEFRSDAELAAAIADLQQQIATAEGRPGIRQFVFSTSKGLK